MRRSRQSSSLMLGLLLCKLTLCGQSRLLHRYTSRGRHIMIATGKLPSTLQWLPGLVAYPQSPHRIQRGEDEACHRPL